MKERDLAQVRPTHRCWALLLGYAMALIPMPHSVVGLLTTTRWNFVSNPDNHSR